MRNIFLMALLSYDVENLFVKLRTTKFREKLHQIGTNSYCYLSVHIHEFNITTSKSYLCVYPYSVISEGAGRIIFLCTGQVEDIGR